MEDPGLVKLQPEVYFHLYHCNLRTHMHMDILLGNKQCHLWYDDDRPLQ